jgi:hypothetical protein
MINLYVARCAGSGDVGYSFFHTLTGVATTYRPEGLVEFPFLIG